MAATIIGSSSDGLTSSDRRILFILSLIFCAIAVAAVCGLIWIGLGNLLAVLEPTEWYVHPLTIVWSITGRLPLLALLLLGAVGISSRVLSRVGPLRVAIELTADFFLFMFAFLLVVSVLSYEPLGSPFVALTEEQYASFRTQFDREESHGVWLWLAVVDRAIIPLIIIASWTFIAPAVRRFSVIAFLAMALVVAILVSVSFANASRNFLLPKTGPTVAGEVVPIWFRPLSELMSAEFREKLNTRAKLRAAYNAIHPEIEVGQRQADSFLRLDSTDSLKPAGALSRNEMLLFYIDEALSVITLDFPELFNLRFTNVQPNTEYSAVSVTIFVFKLLITLTIAPAVYWALGVLYRALGLSFSPRFAQVSASGRRKRWSR